MKIIILGGNAAHNRPWTQQLADYIAKEAGYNAYAHYYRHWQTRAKFIDIDYELQTLADSGILIGEYGIIAKSMGGLLTLKGIHTGLLKPAASLLLGFPLEIVRGIDLPAAAWIARLPEGTQFIQNSHDPLGPYTDVAGYLTAAGVVPRSIPKWQGATHEYTDTAAITSALVSALHAAS